MAFKIYQPFESADIISGKTNTVSSGFFPGGEISMSQSSFRTSSAQVKLTGSNGIYDVLNGTYYTNVYNNSVISPQLLFTIAYGDFNGNGIKTGSIFNHTKAIYTQYKNLLLGTVDQDGKFSFETGSASSATYVTSSEVYIISFASDLMKDQIDRGQWNMLISGSVSNNISLIDELPLLTDSEKKEQRLVYQVVSGTYDSSLGRTVSDSSATVGYQGLGLFYPKNGIIVLNASKLSTLAGIPFNNLTSSATDPVNHRSLYSAINGAPNGAVSRVRKSEIVPASHYFIRVKNQDFNFSNNPSFVYQTTTSDVTRGEILTSIQTSPKTYITTVGLYNELNELIAVAKLSRPTRKDFSNELLIRVRLDF